MRNVLIISNVTYFEGYKKGIRSGLFLPERISSYIYALFSSGAAWYGNNLPVTGVQKIFDAMVNACIAKRGRPLSNDDILKIPDIDMFKDIYMQ